MNKSILKYFALLCAGAMIAPQAFGAVSDKLTRVEKAMSTVKPVREFRGHKPWSNPGEELTAELQAKKAGGKRKVAEYTPAIEFAGLSNYDFLEAPDGTTWFYTTEVETKSVETGGTDLDGNPYTEEHIVAYTFHIYDNTFTKVATIHDDVVFGENETRVASVSLDPALTKKFFNYDDKTEVMVYLAMNTYAGMSYKVNYYNKVYSLGGEKDEKGNDVCIETFTGRCVDAINTATNAWSENYFLTFVDDIVPNESDYDTLLDYVQAYKSQITTYTKAGWNGGPTAIITKEIPLVNYPGDTTDGIYFISKAVDGKPYFFYSMYEKPYMVDPTGFTTDESATPDNNFVVEAYVYNGSEMTPVSTTSIPVEIEKSSTSVPYTFYSIGSLAWHDDIDMSVNGTTSAPAYIVAIDRTTAADLETVVTDFVMYDNDGKEVSVLASEIDGVMMLSNIDGYEPQALFVNVVNNAYIYNFVDIYSGDKVLSLPQTIDGEELTVTGDRVATADGYGYAFVLLNDTQDADGNQYVGVMWLDEKGKVERIDRVNAGKDVARAIVNMWGPVLSPYLFDTDDKMEYAVLVGRYNSNGSEVNNEFLVVDDNGEALADFVNDEEKGKVYVFTVILDSKQNRLQMVYHKDFTEYSIDIYDLPLRMMEGGDGTAENPYMIAGVGDLQMIKAHPEAYYVLSRDIDANGFVFTPIEKFSGSLDGQNHHVSNLVIGSSGIAASMFEAAEAGATVSNLVFVDPTVRIDNNEVSGAAVVASTSRSATFSNIRVYGLEAVSEQFNGMFGGIVANPMVATAVNGCGVFAANIDLPSASDVGGVVGAARTGTTVTAAAFTGDINASKNAGGIAGALYTGDETIADCHVEADITAKNTIGGIVGMNARGKVQRCYVEGKLTATEADRWGYGYATGGVVGELKPDWEGVEDNVIIEGNIVALESINVPSDKLEEEYPGQKNSVHRIVGASSHNEADFDYDSNWNPVYGELYPEYGLADNYALKALDVVDKDTEATAVSTEGASLDAIDRGFLDETLGWQFGTTPDTPWSKNTDNAPWLYYETSFVITPAVRLVEEKTKFNLTIRFYSDHDLTVEEIGADFLCEYDNTIIEMTDNASMTSDNTLLVEFEALKLGTTDVKVTIEGHESTATVTVVEEGTLGDTGSAIDTTVGENGLALIYDGRNITAAGAYIEVYTMSGIKAAAGNNSVSVETLPRGIYVATAVDARGNRGTIKVVL